MVPFTMFIYSLLFTKTLKFVGHNDWRWLSNNSPQQNAAKTISIKPFVIMVVHVRDSGSAQAQLFVCSIGGMIHSKGTWLQPAYIGRNKSGKGSALHVNQQPRFPHAFSTPRLQLPPVSQWEDEDHGNVKRISVSPASSSSVTTSHFQSSQFSPILNAPNSLPLSAIEWMKSLHTGDPPIFRHAQQPILPPGQHSDSIHGSSDKVLTSWLQAYI